MQPPPISFIEKNPKRKGTDSHTRFERYRHALTIRDALRKGASWQDVLWDFERYYLAPNAARANQAQAVLDYRARGISSIPAAVVDDEGNALTTDIYSALTLQESLQLDYANVALDHLNSIEPATRRLLKIALNETTLTQFAFACASRVLIDEPMTVKEALASEHADEWQAAIDEEVNNLILYNCFEVVPRSEAMHHGKLVKSKWVFKVKYDRDNNPYRFRARLVAKGFSQSSAHGDFDETYSPVMAYPSLRALLALAAANDYMITGFDIKNAFVQQRTMSITSTWNRLTAFPSGKRHKRDDPRLCIA